MTIDCRKPDADHGRTLTVRRLGWRAALGLVARAAQGLMLAASVAFLSAEAASDLAVALTACTVLNLVSNAGIPTLMVRAGRMDAPATDRFSLGRAYVYFTAAAVLLLPVPLWLVVHDLFLVTATTCLLAVQSIYTGLEYWKLGHGNAAYDTFLRRSATIQAAVSLGAPALLVLVHSSTAGVAILVLAYGTGILIALRGGPGPVLRKLRRARPTRAPRASWRRDALAVGAGTMTAAVFYGADVFVLRATASADIVASYRLAITCVAFAVGVLPVSLLVLADASSGRQTNFARLSVLAVILGVVVCVAGAMLGQVFPTFASVGSALVLLGPLASTRVLSQVLTTTVHGLGRHRWVAISYLVGVLGWTVGAVMLSLTTVAFWKIALVETLLEGMVLVLLVVALCRKVTGNRRQGEGEAAPDQTPSPVRSTSPSARVIRST